MTPDASLPPADVAAESCYCVCHSSFSSRAWCEHCQGDNAVGRVPRCTVPDQSNAFGTCARALPCAVHPAADEQRPTPPLTEEELAAMVGRVEAATAGPWYVDRGGEFDDPYYSIPSVCRDRYGDNSLMVGSDKATADFIAHARTDVPRLIADLRASRAKLAELSWALAELSWATKEYDEDTGYCLCGCCRHGI